MNSTVIALFIALFPFLTNIYVIKYLHDIRENKQCKDIDSKLLTFYYDAYIVSQIILAVSIIGILISFSNHTDIFKGKYTENITKLFFNSKIIDVLTIVLNAGLVKLIYDLRSESSCVGVDASMSSNIYYSSILGLIAGAFNLMINTGVLKNVL